MGQVPELVTVHVFGVPTRAIPQAFGRIARDPRRLRTVPGLTFARVLGTNDGTTFTARSNDYRHWALVSCWSSEGAAQDFELSPVARGWGGLAQERLLVRLRPVASRGQWSGREPFGAPTPRRTSSSTGAVASITRARLTPRKALTFWRAVPSVAADLHQVEGVRLAIGVGEAPVGFQGTFSIWESADAVTEFAHRRRAHQVAIERTAQERWYAEELFARFDVLDIEGTYDFHAP